MTINSDKPLLEVKNIKKSFGHVEALRGVSLKAYAGHVLAVVGDNGAGKSTLIKALSGVLAPDEGEIIIGGSSYHKLTPKLALANGISTVYQDLALVNTQDIVENIFLGHEHRKLGFLNKKRMRKEAVELLVRLGIQIPGYDVLVKDLSGGQRQSIAVARAVHQGGRLLIFDEPTAAMGLKETAAVEDLIKKLVESGFGIIIISHNIPQVFKLSDRICVMRQGSVVDIVDTPSVTTEDIVSMITGASAVC
ncbi:MAG: ATP-binding cassette domain-containing protein [Bacillota bacterium]|jgi:ABC-type sugar transport system ATPase subunit